MISWLERQHDESLFLSVVTLGEIQKGISKLPHAPKSVLLEKQLARILPVFEERVLPLDTATLLRWGVLCGKSERQKMQLPVLDSLIAATALEHGLQIATRNVKDFERCGVEVVNPWEG